MSGLTAGLSAHLSLTSYVIVNSYPSVIVEKVRNEKGTASTVRLRPGMDAYRLDAAPYRARERRRGGEQTNRGKGLSEKSKCLIYAPGFTLGRLVLTRKTDSHYVITRGGLY